MKEQNADFKIITFPVEIELDDEYSESIYIIPNSEYRVKTNNKKVLLY